MAHNLKLVPATTPPPPPPPDMATVERMRALEAYAILDTPPEPVFDEVTTLAAALCGAPIAAVSFVCDHRQWFKAKTGLSDSETPIEQSFCAHAIAGGGTDLFEVRDATCDGRFSENPLVTGDPGIRFYGGIPLLSREGVGLGALCVIDTSPRADGLSALQHQALRTLANQVTAQLELRLAIAERDRHVVAQRTTTEAMHWLATHDPLTGLGNRSLFQSRLQDVIAESDRRRRTALLILDVDHFKQINDTLGHDAGDEVLKAIGDRLSAATRSTDTVARLGGDEFGIILHGIGSEEEIGPMTQSIFARLQEPIVHRDRLIDARLTIGAAIFPDHAVSAADLIRHADIALYAAKAAGRGRAALFDPAMLFAAQQHAAMIRRARAALANDAIVPCYQPKYDLATRRLVGFEALLRVHGLDGGYDPPSVIAAAFEDAELATRLGATMIAQVAADMRGWIEQGLEFGRIAVNASASEFRDHGFAERVLAALAAAGVSPDRLEIEVTETVLLDRDALPVERALRALTAAGVKIALDDFGTGYASLAHLNRFPVHVLKIDRSFIPGIEESAGTGAIVHAILNMAENLGIETVAEGIETVAQADYLRRKGCVVGQGYLFGSAQPADRVPEIIDARASTPNQRNNSPLAAAA